MQQNQFALSSSHFCGSLPFPPILHHFPPDGDGGGDGGGDFDGDGDCDGDGDGNGNGDVCNKYKANQNDTAPVSNSAYFKLKSAQSKFSKILHLLLLHHLPQLIQLIFHIGLTFCHMCLQICHLWIQTYSFRPQFLGTFCDHNEI